TREVRSQSRTRSRDPRPESAQERWAGNPGRDARESSLRGSARGRLEFFIVAARPDKVRGFQYRAVHHQAARFRRIYENRVDLEGITGCRVNRSGGAGNLAHSLAFSRLDPLESAPAAERCPAWATGDAVSSRAYAAPQSLISPPIGASSRRRRASRGEPGSWQATRRAGVPRHDSICAAGWRSR